MQSFRLPFPSASPARLRLAAALVALAFLGGCASGPSYPLYSPIALARSFGYTEQPLSDTRYQVTYTAPWSHGFDRGSAQRRREADERVALAYDLALWRAAEIALARGYPGFGLADRVNDVYQDVRTDYVPDPWPYRRSRYRPYYPGGYYDRTSTLSVSVILTVDLTDVRGPRTFDARALIAEVQARRPGAAGPPPVPAPAPGTVTPTAPPAGTVTPAPDTVPPAPDAFPPMPWHAEPAPGAPAPGS